MQNALQTMQDTLFTLIHEADKSAEEYNDLCDQMESRDKELAVANTTIKLMAEAAEKDFKLMQKQENVINAAIANKKIDLAEIRVARAKVKELQTLNPQRLAKVCQAQRAARIEMKAEMKKLMQQRKEVIKKNKNLAEIIAKGNNSPNADIMLHKDKDNNAIRFIPTLFVGADNDLDGVPHSPVLEYICHARGISRQGILCSDGNIAWASAKNSNPSAAMSQVARAEAISYCTEHNIKLEF